MLDQPLVGQGTRLARANGLLFLTALSEDHCHLRQKSRDDRYCYRRRNKVKDVEYRQPNRRSQATPNEYIARIGHGM